MNNKQSEGTHNSWLVIGQGSHTTARFPPPPEISMTYSQISLKGPSIIYGKIFGPPHTHIAKLASIYRQNHLSYVFFSFPSI